MLDSLNEEPVIVQLDESDSAWLSEEAAERGMAPDEWVRSLLLAHRNREPQWSAGDLNWLADIAEAIRQIRELNRSDGSQSISVAIGDAVLRAFMDRVKAEAQRRMTYWGVGYEPVAEGGAEQRVMASVQAAG